MKFREKKRIVLQKIFLSYTYHFYALIRLFNSHEKKSRSKKLNDFEKKYFHKYSV